MRTTCFSSQALTAVLAISTLLLARATPAGEEGYRPDQKDTRPVKKEPLPPGHTHDDGHDHSDHEHADNGPLEVPAPELKGKLNYDVIKMLAIQEAGRKKPLSTYVFEHMEQLVGRPVFSSEPYVKDKLSSPPRKIAAMDLFFALWFTPDEWARVPIVLVPDANLKKALGFDLKESHFSLERIIKTPKFKELIESSAKKSQDGEEKSKTELEKEAEIVYQRLEIMTDMMKGSRKLMLVPHPSSTTGDWQSLKMLEESYSKGEPYYPPEKFESLRLKYNSLVEAFQKREANAFTDASQALRDELVSLSPTVYPKHAALDREVTYNEVRPFGKAWVLYFLAAAIGLISLKTSSKLIYGAMFAFFLAGLAMNIYGFTLRCLIAGRPPVSNMYESVIWVGFGAVFFGLIFELIYRKRYFAVSGAAAGFLCLVLMDVIPVVMGNAKMPGFEADIKPLVPVLRDNFWLTVHVLTITLSYAAFMLAWVLGHVTLTKHLTSPAARSTHHELHQFVYRAIQVGVLLLSIGTILGGVWAYYSWGRFWGWDPKETWAFIALMCYLFVLHGRFTGWWGNFGMSVGSVICFQAIVMAWYGVNFVLGELGGATGLHSYGTGAGGKQYVFGAVALDMLFTAIAVARHATYKNLTDKDDADPNTLTTTDPITEVRGEFLKPSESAGE